MKLISWNVNGLRACLGKGFLDYFHSAGADYVCGLDFLSPGAYTVGGHKNRGAVRLRSA